jgi:hypothetical protein
MRSRRIASVLCVMALGLSSPALAQRPSKRSGKADKSAEARETSSGDELGDLDEELVAGPPAAESAEEAEVEAEASSDETSGDEAVQDNAEPEALPSETDGAAETQGPTLRAAAFVGSGIGTRSLRRPVPGGSQRLDTSVFPAAELGLEVHAWPERALSLGFLLNYQTSLGLTVEERPPFALPNEVGTRSERAEFSVGPIFKLAEGSGAARIAIPLGGILRNFWPEARDMLTPRYTLIGPAARIELWLQLGERLRLRVGPEAHWLAFIGPELKVDGVASQGVALGAEVHLTLQLSEHFALELNVRQSNALASSTSGPSFSDVERFVTARVVGVL